MPDTHSDYQIRFELFMNMGYINGSFNKMALPFFLFSIMIGQTQNSIRPPTIPPIQFLLDKDICIVTRLKKRGGLKENS